MKWLATCYTSLQHRRGWLVLLLLLLASACLFNLSRLRIEESIVAMLPDGDSRVASDFALLQQAPFARKVVIHLRATPEVATGELLAATGQLREALPTELFSNRLSGPGEIEATPMLQELGSYLALLADRHDLQQIEQQLTPAAIDAAIATDLAQLLQPQGIALKEKIRRDPLDLQRLALAKLRYLNPLPGVRLEQGYFLSRDGRSSLILADTPVLITDAAGGRRLVDAFTTARQQLPDGISADLISGHPYTLANAEAIKGDVQRVLLVSGIGILLLFLFCLRRLRALAVYLLPLLSIAIALLVTSLAFDRLSGITVGFGAVLLGITIDFGLHVYFALIHGRGERTRLLRAVARPVLFGGLTTLAAFAVLLRSELPGQRQLALFAIAGIIAALLLALLVLPHFIGGGAADAGLAQRRQARSLYDRVPRLRVLVLAVWCGIALFCAVQAQTLTVNGELRQLSYLPVELQQAEQRLAEVWGEMRGRALIFVTAPDLPAALETNEQVWNILGERQIRDDAVSLAPLLVAPQTGQQRLQEWQQFWQRHQADTVKQLQRSGAQHGFAANAFEPFVSGLRQTPGPIDPQTLRRWGLGSLLDNLLIENEREVRLLTLVPDRPEVIGPIEAELTTLPGVTLVSQSRFGRQLSREIGVDFGRFIIMAGLAVLLLLLLLFRRLPELLLALLPVLTGLLAMFGGMSWLGLELNLFNVVASILIIGLGVDYGIFMVCAGQQAEDLASSRAVLVSGLTTLVGFGSLVLARHPALHSIGITVLLGISAAVPTAMLVIPAFRPKRG